jgi:hypothetical protein
VNAHAMGITSRCAVPEVMEMDVIVCVQAVALSHLYAWLVVFEKADTQLKAQSREKALS